MGFKIEHCDETIYCVASLGTANTMPVNLENEATEIITYLNNTELEYRKKHKPPSFKDKLIHKLKTTFYNCGRDGTGLIYEAAVIRAIFTRYQPKRIILDVLPDDLSYDEMPLHAVSTENPAVDLQTKELAELIRQLPTGFQTIFNLYAVEGYKHVEIASMLGINEGTSRSQYARARVLLIEWIEKYSLKEKNDHYGSK